LQGSDTLVIDYDEDGLAVYRDIHAVDACEVLQRADRLPLSVVHHRQARFVACITRGIAALAGKSLARVHNKQGNKESTHDASPSIAFNQ
jgi:hypothetical protein